MLSTGVPLLILDVCSESEVTFICSVNESETLRWDIDFSSGHLIERVAFSQSDTIGQVQTPTHDHEGTRVAYHFNFTSKSPLTSTMTTSMPTDLSGATVSCSDRLQYSGDEDIATSELTLCGKLLHACHTSTVHVCYNYY